MECNSISLSCNKCSSTVLCFDKDRYNARSHQWNASLLHEIKQIAGAKRQIPVHHHEHDPKLTHYS